MKRRRDTPWTREKPMGWRTHDAPLHEEAIRAIETYKRKGKS